MNYKDSLDLAYSMNDYANYILIFLLGRNYANSKKN